MLGDGYGHVFQSWFTRVWPLVAAADSQATAKANIHAQAVNVDPRINKQARVRA